MPNIILIHNDYPDKGSLSRVLNYVLRSDLIGGYAIDPTCAFRQMHFVKRVFHKEDGVQLKHFIISFAFSELYQINFDNILGLGFWVGQMFADYQIAYAIHIDAQHTHLHLVMNTVSFINGRKYCDGNVGFLKLRNRMQELFPRSDVGLYWSDPRSGLNKYTYAEEDYLLRIG